MKKKEFDQWLEFSYEYWGRERCWDRWRCAGGDPYLERVWFKGKRLLIRRRIYEIFRGRGIELGGPLRKSQPLVCTCGTPNCLNPWHQMPAVSAKSMIESGEWAGHPPNDPRGAHNREKSHCPYGHPYSEDNTSLTPDGQRRCLACKRERVWLPRDLRWIVFGNRHEAVAGLQVQAPEEFDDEDLPDTLEVEHGIPDETLREWGLLLDDGTLLDPEELDPPP